MAATFSIKSQDGKVVKNLSGAEVKRLLDEGKIKKDDMISKDGSGQWHPASKYKTASPSKKETKEQEEETSVPSDMSQKKNQLQDESPENTNNQTVSEKESQNNDGSVTTKKSMTLREAIDEVLRSSTTPLYYKDIAEAIVSEGLWKNFGAKPSNTVYNCLSYSIREEKDQSPYLRVGRGVFALKEKSQATDSGQENIEADENESDEQYAIITSFGMFWRKEAIEWNATPKLLGMQQIGATPVDFCKQLGIYLLYDGREVIYVGRSTDRPLGKRLYEHTIDRLSARWDRFSWFGLLPISDDGQIGLLPETYKATNLIPALEAILIEALEPRQNRKRGDDLAAVEYLQQVDPAIEKKRIKATLDAALNKL